MNFNKKIKPATDINSVKRSAFWHLSRRDHSEYELREKLARKTDNQQWIEDVITECYQFGYLDDERFIDSFVRSAQQKGFGINRIQRDLQHKGIKIESDFDRDIQQPFDYVDSALQLLQKRYHERIENSHLKQKVMAFLQNKGHTFEHIYSAISRHNEYFPIEEYNPISEALTLLNKKFYSLISDKKQKDKATRFLVSRGYSFNDTQAVINLFNQQINQQED